MEEEKLIHILVSIPENRIEEFKKLMNELEIPETENDPEIILTKNR